MYAKIEKNRCDDVTLLMSHQFVVPKHIFVSWASLQTGNKLLFNVYINASAEDS